MNPELLTITENITLNINGPDVLLVSVFDAITIVENVSVYITVRFISVSDLVTISENLTPRPVAIIGIFDSVGVTDSFAVYKTQSTQMPLSRPQGSV